MSPTFPAATCGNLPEGSRRSSELRGGEGLRLDLIDNYGGAFLDGRHLSSLGHRRSLHRRPPGNYDAADAGGLQDGLAASWGASVGRRS